MYSHFYNIDIIQLRFFNVYGPSQRPNLAIYKFTKYRRRSNTFLRGRVFRKRLDIYR
ncbi:hypothetical protein [uncultured Ilyobacter sp.]|uniref:hypothetical protein n=1 Tax=uncultured Ilyobacter sp. TaxID=544433 RepID=UPI0029C603BA|nr:hypothetical protein [uncultured Ilyobacter sp.]